MLIADSEMVIAFDVDDTLIIWDEQSHKGPKDGYIAVKCPHDGVITYHRPHKRHVKFLKRQKAKGYTVIVWSAGGTGWAAEVVKALDLEKHVDIAIAKPQKYVDDIIDANHVLGIHIFLDEEGHSI